MSAASRRIVLSCEHAGNAIPKQWAALFRNRSRELASHRGWDPGALAVAKRLARSLAVPLVAAKTSRLLVDLNRSPHNPAIFSNVTRGLSRSERVALIERVHAPHWQRIRSLLDSQGGPVAHIAVHSFTPVLDGKARNFDVGLLYDPARRPEREFAARLRRALETRAPGLRVRRNAPYRGRADGLTTAMRRERKASAYLGIELELSQASIADPRERSLLVAALASALPSAL